MEQTLEQRVEELESAFLRHSDGRIDFAGHRDFHLAERNAAVEQAKFWRELRLDLIKKGTWFLIVVIAGLTLTGFYYKSGLHHIKP